MRRAPIIIAATVVGTTAVLLYKPIEVSSLAGASTSSDDTSSSTSSSGGTSSASTGSSAAATPTPSATAGGAKQSSAKGVSAVETGSAVTTQFGTTQVKVTIKNGTITEVTAVELNQNDPRSYQISENAAPTLRSEVLSKQSASVDTVSGATYTSLAYEASLQAALDKAGYTAPDGSKASTATPVVEGGH